MCLDVSNQASINTTDKQTAVPSSPKASGNDVKSKAKGIAPAETTTSHVPAFATKSPLLDQVKLDLMHQSETEFEPDVVQMYPSENGCK